MRIIELECKENCTYDLNCPLCPIVMTSIKKVLEKEKDITVQGHQAFSTKGDMQLIAIAHEGKLNIEIPESPQS